MNHTKDEEQQAYIDYLKRSLTEASLIIYKMVDCLDDLPGLTESFNDLDAHARSWLKEYAAGPNPAEEK